ncbi:MAG: DUF6585 family protein [Chloroflexota bacterium]|nr:DUF6585 family protein [Chloroflexota bacterium]
MSDENPKLSLQYHSVQPNTDPSINIFLPKDHNLKRWGLAILGGSLILAVSVSSLLLILRTYTSILRHGRAVLLKNVMLLLPLVFIGIPVGVLLILWAKEHWGDRLILNDRGLILKNGKKERFWRWEKTENMDTVITNTQFGGSSVGTKVKLMLDDGNQGKLLVRNRYENISDLVEEIRKRALPYIYKKAIHKLACNEEIIFHPELTARKEGIEINNRLIPWADGTKPQVKNNNFIIQCQKDQEPLFKSNLKKIENLDLLLCLFENPPKFNHSSSPK